MRTVKTAGVRAILFFLLLLAYANHAWSIDITEMIVHNASPLVIRIHEGKHSKWIKVRKLTKVRPGQFIQINDSPKKGTIEVRGVRVRYTPMDGEQGRDQFSLLICDSVDSCVRQEVVAIIDTHDKAPKAAYLEFYLKENEGSRWETPYLDDEINEPSRVELIRVPDSLQVESNRKAFRVINRPGWTGITGFIYRACDYLDQCIEATAHVTVLPNARLSGAVVSKSGIRSKTEDGLLPLTTEPLIDLQTGKPIDAEKITVYLRFDSELHYALVIDGVTLKPGNEIILPGYPISQNGQRISLDARWDNPESVPNRYIGELTVRVVNYDVPNQVFPVFAGEIARRIDLEDVPRPISVIGFRKVPSGMETNYSLNREDIKHIRWVAEYANNPDIKQSGTGPTFTFKGSRNGYWTLSAKVVEGATQSTWTGEIQVSPVPLSKPLIAKRVEQEKLVFLQGLPKSGTWPGLESEWLLPDGTSTKDNPVKHIMGKSEYGLYSYRVWNNSDPDHSEQTTVMINDQSTDWPDWKLSKRVSANRWPIEVDYHIIPGRIDYVNKNMEHLSFQYLTPPNATISFRYLNRATVKFDEGGDYPIIVRISDDRGHRTELKDVISLDELPPLEGALDIFSEDPWYRVPLSLTVTPVIKQSIEGETVTSYRYYLDGKLQHEGTDEKFVYRNIEVPGRHAVRVEARTNYGRHLAMKDQFTAISTDPPGCNISLTINEKLHNWMVETDCRENHGTIRNLKWQLSLEDAPDEYITFGAHNRKLDIPHWASRRGIQNIRLEAKNDKGNVSYALMDFKEERRKSIDRSARK